MRKMLYEKDDIDRAIIEVHIVSVLKIGQDFGFDISLIRYPEYTRISLKQYYYSSPIMIDSVEILFYHDHTGVEVERVVTMTERQKNSDRVIRSDRAEYADYGAEALEHIMRIVWDIENEHIMKIALDIENE